MFFNRKEIEGFITERLYGLTYNPSVITHVIDMLDEIQKRILSQISDRLYYTPDKFSHSQAGLRNSKFVELCADERWEEADLIGDRINKDTLSQTTIYQDFVKNIKSSGEYRSIVRNMKLKILGYE